MDEADLNKAFERIDAMSERCDYVISRNRPLTLDEPPKPRVRPAQVTRKSQATPVRCEAIASGPLTGNEMQMSSGYSPQPRERDDCDPDGMWAAFESDFDDMVAGMH